MAHCWTATCLSPIVCREQLTAKHGALLDCNQAVAEQAQGRVGAVERAEAAEGAAAELQGRCGQQVGPWILLYGALRFPLQHMKQSK